MAAKNIVDVVGAMKDYVDDTFVTHEEEKEEGAYNLLINTAVSQTINSATFTVNADKTITVNRTSTGQAQALYNIGTVTGVTYCKFVGCPSGGSSTTYSITIYNQTLHTYGIGEDTGNGLIVNLNPNYIYQMQIVIRANETISNRIFKPMVTADLHATYDSYVAPVMSNLALTNALTEINNNLAEINNNLAETDKIYEAAPGTGTTVTISSKYGILFISRYFNGATLNAIFMRDFSGTARSIINTFTSSQLTVSFTSSSGWSISNNVGGNISVIAIGHM